MTGVLLVNMGGPRTSRQMRIFLKRMFRDPFILPFSYPVRFFLAWMISIFRYRKSWKKYKLIGGTPIPQATGNTALKLQEKLGNAYKVTYAFSYSSPLIKKSLVFFKKEGISEIIVIPLYPQASYSTTSSVKADVDKIFTAKDNFNIRFVKEFHQHDLFIKFWSEIIQKHLKEKNCTKPFLLFSAHSIPKYLQEKGDTYPWSVAECANRIAKNLCVEYDFAWQSGMKRGEWLKPDTKEILKELKGFNGRQIILVPISFINENLETLYDLDMDIIPYAKTELGIKSISRVTIPEANRTYIDLLTDLVLKS